MHCIQIIRTDDWCEEVYRMVYTLIQVAYLSVLLGRRVMSVEENECSPVRDKF